MQEIAIAAEGPRPIVGHRADYCDVIGPDGRWNGTVLTRPDHLLTPFKLQKPATIFVCQMSDLFHRKVPVAFIDRVFTTMILQPRHRFLILTKRPQRMKQYVLGGIKRGRVIDAVSGLAGQAGFPSAPELADRVFDSWRQRGPGGGFSHILFGASIANRRDALEFAPLLASLKRRGLYTWLSAEPLVGCVGWSEFMYFRRFRRPAIWVPSIDWLVMGCESGIRRRPCDPAWLRSGVEWGNTNGVPVFVKQMAVNGKVEGDKGHFPTELQVQEVPKCAVVQEPGR